jgi:hypothetical protein
LIWWNMFSIHNEANGRWSSMAVIFLSWCMHCIYNEALFRIVSSNSFIYTGYQCLIEASFELWNKWKWNRYFYEWNTCVILWDWGTDRDN